MQLILAPGSTAFQKLNEPVDRNLRSITPSVSEERNRGAGVC
jgi:hypothetical protein